MGTVCLMVTLRSMHHRECIPSVNAEEQQHLSIAFSMNEVTSYRVFNTAQPKMDASFANLNTGGNMERMNHTSHISSGI